MSGERRVASGEKEDLSSLTTRYSPLAVYAVAAMEVVLLVLVCLSPWAYGAVHPPFEFLLDAGIAVLLALWAVRMLLEGQITWKKSGVALCLVGLFLFGVWQRMPLPGSVLSWLSPGTVCCYERLLPEQPEILAEDAVQSEAGPRPGSTLSLYPGATRQESLRYLAVFLVFALVYNNLTSKRALTRLSIVLVVNGVLLSLFALAQFFGAPPKTVYWHYPTSGSVFGPFINRDHFPDYVNMCIGLGIGLLVSQNMRSHSSASLEEEGSLLQTLHNPVSLWICVALGLMVCAVAFSLSRGGLLALGGASVLCGVLGWLRLGRSFRLGSLVFIAGVVVALFSWFGTSLLKERLATLGSSEAYEGRLPLWLRSLTIVRDFPIWGTGYGTFDYIEPMYRKDAASWKGIVRYEHAHNDYLEILVEGGLVGLCLAATALALVYRRGYLALIRRSHSEREGRSSADAGLALGALFAFSAVAMHSFGDWGAHIPAITLLATVVCAHLCALGQSESHKNRSTSEGDSDEYRLRLGGFAPVLGASAALGFGFLLCTSGWKVHQIDRLQRAALRTGNADADQLRRRVDYLASAALLGPDNARLHYELGSAHGRLAQLLAGGDLAELLRRGNLAGALEKVNSPEGRAAREQGMLALREQLRARDACPLLSEAYLGIASYASESYMKRGDKSEDYLRRFKLLAPGRDDLWYLCGFQEFTRNHFEDAWASWRHCLELSDRYLPQILNQTKRLQAEQLVEKVLPNNPDLLLEASLLLYPGAGVVKQRRPFMEKARRLLESSPEGMVRRELRVKDRVLQGRLEFARYLSEQGKPEEARRELMLVLAQDSKHDAARVLLSEITRQRR